VGRFGQICIIQTKKAAIAIRKLPLKPVILNKQSVDSRKMYLFISKNVISCWAGESLTGLLMIFKDHSPDHTKPAKK